jgi:hypothetical protein
MGFGTSFIKTSYTEKQKDNLSCFQSVKDKSHENILLNKEELIKFNKYKFTE